MEDYMEKEDFMKLNNDEVANIVKMRGKPRVLCLIADGTRKKNIIVDGIDPKSRLLEYNTASPKNHNDYIELIKEFYAHGIDTLILPIVAKGNIHRSPEYHGFLINNAIKMMFTSDIWHNFFTENDIKVRVYGDLKYLSEPHYPQLIDWVKILHERTEKNQKRKIFFGVEYGQSIEEVRLTKIAIDIYKDTGKTPTREDLIRAYYGDLIEPLDILIRPSVIRDSDMQPILISGRAEFYFPVTSLQQINHKMFREILYDYLFQRVISSGRKDYSDGVSSEELEYMKKYFDLNKEAVIGLGRRMNGGHFWHPIPQIKLPDDRSC